MTMESTTADNQNTKSKILLKNITITNSMTYQNNYDVRGSHVDAGGDKYDNDFDAVEYLSRYENMVLQQEREDSATLEHMHSCIEQFEEIISEGKIEHFHESYHDGVPVQTVGNNDNSHYLDHSRYFSANTNDQVVSGGYNACIHVSHSSPCSTTTAGRLEKYLSMLQKEISFQDLKIGLSVLEERQQRQYHFHQEEKIPDHIIPTIKKDNRRSSKPSPKECILTDRQFMLVLRLLSKNSHCSATITWGEFIQCYKICITGMTTMQYYTQHEQDLHQQLDGVDHGNNKEVAHVNKNNIIRARVRDRTLAIMSLFMDPGINNSNNNNKGTMATTITPIKPERTTELSSNMLNIQPSPKISIPEHNTYHTTNSSRYEMMDFSWIAIVVIYVIILICYKGFFQYDLVNSMLTSSNERSYVYDNKTINSIHPLVFDINEDTKTNTMLSLPQQYQKQHDRGQHSDDIFFNNITDNDDDSAVFINTSIHEVDATSITEPYKNENVTFPSTTPIDSNLFASIVSKKQNQNQQVVVPVDIVSAPSLLFTVGTMFVFPFARQMIHQSIVPILLTFIVTTMFVSSNDNLQLVSFHRDKNNTSLGRSLCVMVTLLRTRIRRIIISFRTQIRQTIRNICCK